MGTFLGRKALVLIAPASLAGMAAAGAAQGQVPKGAASGLEHVHALAVDAELHALVAAHTGSTAAAAAAAAPGRRSPSPLPDNLT
jgi:hypothetical protein